MSPSTRSKPASPSSPETGDGAEPARAAPAGAADSERPSDRPRSGSTLEIQLERSPQRTAGWTLFELVLGVLLIANLGSVGGWVGVTLLVHGGFRGADLLSMIMNPPGRIAVSEREVILPRGLSGARPLKVAPSDVTAVYFLRRSVPWNHAAPVLVIELGAYALAYPRDWFASEADQRHVIHALLRGVGAPGETSSDAKVALATSIRNAHIKLAVGAILLAVGLGLWFATRAPVATSSLYAMYVAPIVAGWILVWRWLTRL